MANLAGHPPISFKLGYSKSETEEQKSAGSSSKLTKGLQTSREKYQGYSQTGKSPEKGHQIIIQFRLQNKTTTTGYATDVSI